jgi:hypothetical protein
MELDPETVEGDWISVMNQWHMVVDDKLNDIYQQLNHINGIRNLLIAMQLQSICDEFRIKLRRGDPVRFGVVGNAQAPTYDIEGGTAKVNGEYVGIDGKYNVRAPFLAYVNFTLVEGDEEGTYEEVIDWYSTECGYDPEEPVAFILDGGRADTVFECGNAGGGGAILPPL